MEVLHKITILMHVLAGITTLVAGPIAIFYNFRDVGRHRFVGKVFFFAMLVVCFSSFMAVINKPEHLFYQFLAAISCIVLIGITHGVRAIFIMKGKPVILTDKIISVLQSVIGMGMMIQSGILYNGGKNIAFVVLFAVFGTGAFLDGIKHFRQYMQASGLSALHWMHIHLNNMLGAFIASSTAFTVNVGVGLPWYLQWFGPTLLLVPINIYFGRKVKKMIRMKAVKVANS